MARMIKPFICAAFSLALSATSASAANTSYVDASGGPAVADATAITSSTQTLEAGWYVVEGTVTINSTVTVNGDVNLILADGAKLTVNGTSSSAGISVLADGAVTNSLTIYCQGSGTGELVAKGGYGSAGVGGNNGKSDGSGKPHCGTVTIYGGVINANGNGDAAGIGGGDYYGNGGTVSIYGGKVTAQAGRDADGIGRGYAYGHDVSYGKLIVGSGLEVVAGTSEATATKLTPDAVTGEVTLGGQKYFSIAPPSLKLITSSFTAYSGTAGSSVNANLSDTIRGGTGTYTFRLKEGSSLPLWLTLSGTSLTGTPTEAGLFSFTLVVEDTSEPKLTLEATYTVVVRDRYSIAYRDGESTLSLYPTTYIKGTGVSALPTPIKASNEFQGWFTNALFSGAQFTSISTTDSGDFTFYSKWLQLVTGDVSVTFTGEGGVPRTETCTVVDSSMTTLTDTGATEGWYVVYNNVTFNSKVSISGNVKLVLMDGKRMTITLGSEDYNTALEVPLSASLIIYGQSGQTGRLEATAGSSIRAGIGAVNKNETNGAITINGGVVAASGGTGIGGVYQGSCGAVTINGGTVTATGSSGAGIGGGAGTPVGAGGTVTINGGTVTATGGYSGAGIGGGSSTAEQGTLTVGANVTVKAGSSANPTTELAHGTGGAIDLSTFYRYYTAETTGPTPLSQTQNAFAAYIGDAFGLALPGTVSGGTGSYTFTLKTPASLPAWLTRSGDTLSGTPTTASDSCALTFTIQDTEETSLVDDFTYTITVTAKPKPISYKSGETTLTGLTPTNYVEGTATTLAPTAPAATGYAFAGWYDNAGLAGLPVTAISAEATGPQTFWAKFTPIEYTITYMDGATPMTGLTPTNYTIEAAATLPATATKAGYGFYGWYTNSTFTGSEVTAIPAGSTGNKTFYAKWGAVKVNTPYVDAYGNSMPQQLCAEVTSETTSLETGWYVVNGEVTVNSPITVSGDVKLILADGSHLVVNATGSYDAAIDVSGENALTIYRQTLGTGVLEATGGSISAGIGGGYYSPACGTITINGGTVTATAPSGGAGIGGGYSSSSYGSGTGGTITINGGTVTATGNGAGIGGGGGSPAGAGGIVVVNGGTVTATGGYSGAGVGGGSSSVGQGTLTVASRVTVKAGSSANPTTVLNPNGETVLTSLLTGQRYFTFETVGPTPLVQTVNALVAYKDEATALMFDGTVGGGTSPYTFTFKSGSLPAGISSTTFSGTPTETGTFEFVVTVADSGIGTDAQSADFTYTLTVTARPKPITYYDGAVEITGLTPSNYVEGVGAILPVTAPGRLAMSWKAGT